LSEEALGGSIDLSGDQASGLRRLFGNRAAQVIAFASGHEACGRTTLLVQTAAALAAAGHAVVIIDENAAPNNAISTFGLTARHDLAHILRGERTLRQVELAAAPLVRIVPAARLARDTAILAEQEEIPRRLSDFMREVRREASFVLIDCDSRRGGHLSVLAQAARHLAVVVAAQGNAITHAYALIKRLALERDRDGFQIVITRARAPEEARAIFDNMRRVAREHLAVNLHFLGAAMVPVTEHLADALVTRLPLVYDEQELAIPALGAASGPADGMAAAESMV
jgi:flagellar biosynthesis protein FlhG